MLNNNKRFKLPTFSMIGGATKAFKIPLHDILGNVFVTHIDSLDNINIFDDDRVYLVTDKITGKTDCYLWDGTQYNVALCILSVCEYTATQADLIIEKECIIKQDAVSVTFNFEDTINIGGKFIYQIAICSSTNQNVRYFLEQGTLMISRNIDIAENVINGIDESTYEDDDILFVYEEMNAYIIGSVPFASNWLSLSANGDPLTPDDNVIYIVSDGDYAGKYVWDASTVTYIEYED